jgi:hypothetical protein
MSKVQKIKTHLKDNKKVYIAIGATTVIVSAATAAIFCRVQNIAVVDSFKLAIKSPTTNHIVQIAVPARGHRGEVIFDQTTNTPYGSKTQAATTLGVCRATLDKHLRGDIPNVRGHVLVGLGENLSESLDVQQPSQE